VRCGAAFIFFLARVRFSCGGGGGLLNVDRHEAAHDPADLVGATGQAARNFFQGEGRPHLSRASERGSGLALCFRLQTASADNELSHLLEPLKCKELLEATAGWFWINGLQRSHEPTVKWQPSPVRS